MSASFERDERDRGFSLMELLVAISLLAVVTTLVTVLVVSLATTFSRQESQHDSANQAALGMQHVSRIIRAGTEIDTTTWQPAPIFALADRQAMTLQSYVGVESTEEGPTRVALAIDPATGDLVETRFEPRRSGGVWTYAATPSSRRVLIRDVADTSTFTYLRSDSSELPTRALTEAERREIAAVRVDLVVQTHGTDDAQPVAMRTEVSLRNLAVTRTGTTP